MVGDLDIYILAGQPFGAPVESWEFWGSNPDPEVDTLVLEDFTGASATLTVSDGFLTSTDRLSLTSAGGGLVLGGAAGTITPNVTPTQTAQLWADYGSLLEASGRYEGRDAYYLGPWDLTVTMAGGQPVRRLQGNCYLVPRA